ncbi:MULTISPECIES: DNA helicase RecQ [Empedobacter]|uniref:DNA helicase RecQ n=1 Tax=Empedobacter TaxID=59734 RepID=UPI001CE227D5|nr:MULTISPECIES: DNA helicase RecQ [Empedobacter]MCA4777000.1 DNA helicase RecQ [Empedobacter stercoris]MDM1523987.1 DNA helicase RecQ [Empedobacter sp. 225-1]MDM1543920.1 DNA helicase RecQ [Empedobacter sp. 189-2]
MEATSKNLTSYLKKYFGFDQFKGQQHEIITSLLNKEDVFVLMPTGGGKSLCYQLPALMSDGVAIIVSPLIALMKNQVDAIRGISENDGIAHVLNSSLNKSETKTVMTDIKNGVTKMLYVAPESLTKEEYIDFFKSVQISFFAIDEAHCISEWGHDFRPEYRNLKSIINRIGDAPIIALTATATPKVQEDIQKTLGMQSAKVFKDSFNRTNLFYEIRPKVDQDKQIIKFIKQNDGKSGVIYCLSRKKVEEITQLLQVNGINAIPYHAGLDAKTRSKHQDMFLMEDASVVVATIAFGMGIDKPDVRFVMHYDMPKSLESYYQETGRAGRDGGEGICIAFYDYKDIEKLEKFLASKPVAEREVGMQLLSEVVAYAETSMSRRKFLLHYFGENFDDKNGEGANMDDNMRNPKKMTEAKEDAIIALDVVQKTNQKLKLNDIVNVIVGKETSITKSYNLSSEKFFGIGKEKEDYYWKSILRQLIVHNLLEKEIESYGVLKITKDGKDFINKPTSFEIAEDIDFKKLLSEGSFDKEETSTAPIAFDDVLLKQLKDLRKKISKKHQIPPFAVFQDSSLDDMTMQYPTTVKELTNVYGVGEGKAQKFGKDFVDFIAQYVKDNDIIRPEDMVIKQVADKSSHKVYIIQSTDRKLNLEDVAEAKNMSMSDLLSEMESIVYQGTKLNINYYIDEVLDEDQQEEIYDFLMDADSDSMTSLLDEFGDDYDEEELRLMRIKFISEVAN